MNEYFVERSVDGRPGTLAPCPRLKSGPAEGTLAPCNSSTVTERAPASSAATVTSWIRLWGCSDGTAMQCSD